MAIKPLYEFDYETRQLIVKTHLEMPRGGEVTGPIEGTYGEIYSILLNDSGRTRVGTKSPRIKRFGSIEKARIGVEQVLRELEKTHQVRMVPWINRFFDSDHPRLALHPVAPPRWYDRGPSPTSIF